MGIHLLFFTVEIFTQPLFPWDALDGLGLSCQGLVSKRRDYRGSESGDLADCNCHRHIHLGRLELPATPSIITYWTALSLGAWSETLINLPTLFLGMAIGMALFGQCRESGFSVTTSLLCCYMLYSIPLFGNHIALAGYADIWLAGFTGLGFVALLRALSMDKTDGSVALQLVLGLVMTGLAILVKYEG